MSNSSQSLSNLQHELLKLFSMDVDENYLKAIKSLIANYFAQKAISEADRVWEEKKFTFEDLQDSKLIEQTKNEPEISLSEYMQSRSFV